MALFDDVFVLLALVFLFVFEADALLGVFVLNLIFLGLPLGILTKYVLCLPRFVNQGDQFVNHYVECSMFYQDVHQIIVDMMLWRIEDSEDER